MARQAGLVLGGLLIVLLALVGYVVYQLPRPLAERVVVGAQVVGVHDGYAFSYIVRRGDDAVLIDAGADPEARAILLELERQQLPRSAIKAILVTHGHFDHFAGALSFEAPLYVGAPDHPWVRRVDLPTARLPRLSTRMLRPPPYQGEVRELLPGSVIDAAGMRFLAIAMPGHTRGAMMYLWQDLLFTGDSLQLRADELRTAPWFTSEDARTAEAVLPRLLPFDFVHILDGHVGHAADGRARYERLLARVGAAR